MRLVGVILIFITGMMTSCTNNTNEDLITILNYLDTRGLVAVDTAGVFVVIGTPGTTDRPKENSTIKLTYKGYYIDGEVFDQSSPDQKTLLKLSSSIEGLRYGLAKFGKNSTGSILIPSDLGFGNNAPFGVRRNAILIYDVQVSDFN